MSIGKPDNIISPLENVGSVPIFTRYLPQKTKNTGKSF